MLQSDVAKTERLFQFAYLLISLSLWLVSPLFVWFLFVTYLINSLVRIGNTTSPPLSANNSVIMTSLTSVYFVTIFASIFCNSMIILIIRTRHFLKFLTNYLILNQAYADLIITFTIMLGMLGDDLFFKKWFGGDWGLHLCRPLVWLNFPAEYCSIWSLVAFDRYFAGARPLHLSPVLFHITFVVTVIWKWSIFSVPGMMSMAKQVFVEGTGYVLRYWLFPVVRKQHIRLLCFGVQFLRARFGHDGFAFNRVLTFFCLEKRLEMKLVRMRGTRKP